MLFSGFSSPLSRLASRKDCKPAVRDSKPRLWSLLRSRRWPSWSLVIVDVLARFDDAINNCNISTLAELATPTAAIKIILISVKFVHETRFFTTWNNAYAVIWKNRMHRRQRHLVAGSFLAWHVRLYILPMALITWAIFSNSRKPLMV